MSKVLVLTASFGEGHNQAGIAVSEALQREGAMVKMIDYVEWLNPTFRSLATFSLMQSVQKAPSLYGLFYKSMSRMKSDSRLSKRLNLLGLRRMMRQIRLFQPDAVVSTFPVPAGILSELKGHGWTSIPNVGILTDYTTHGQWIKENVDAYFVPTESVRTELGSRGVPIEKIHAYGMPVRAKFAAQSMGDLPSRRLELREKYGIHPDKPLILLMGGGAGLLSDMSSWEKLMNRLADTQFTIICGRNERLFKKMQTMNTPRTRVLGYTKEVDEWMIMADLIVTKAGGITVTECMTMELPMLLYRPIPGQEDKNAQFAIDHGFAVKAKEFRTAREWMVRMMEDPAILEKMRHNARKAKTPESAQHIAEHVTGLIASHQLLHPKKAIKRMKPQRVASITRR